MKDLPGGLYRDVGIKYRREGSVGVPCLDRGRLGRRPPPSSFIPWCGLEWEQQAFQPCLAVVSGSDVVQGGIFFSLNLKGFILERGTDCTFSTGGSFLVVNTKIQYIL